MAMVSVPRAELARLVGLPAGVDDETLNEAINAALARTQTVSAAEQRARAEDRAVVLAAVRAGKIHQSRIEFWCAAMKKDRAGNRAVIASLAPGLPHDGRAVVDEELEQIHGQVLGRLGITAEPRTVAASTPVSQSSGAVDMLGIPIPGIPAPVRIVRGKDPQTWTEQERSNYFLHQLGGHFRQGVPPPPGSEGVYFPSPNDTAEYVENGDGTGQWQPRPDYQPRSEN